VTCGTLVDNRKQVFSIKVLGCILRPAEFQTEPSRTKKDKIMRLAFKSLLPLMRAALPAATDIVVPVLAAVALGLAATAAKADTIMTIDAPGSTLYPVSGSACSGNTAGSLIYTDCYGGPGQFLSPGWYPERLALLVADISSLSGSTLDHVFLSLTEIRTGPLYTGTANVYVTNDSVPGALDPNDTGTFLQGVDVTLAGGTTLVGSLTGTGIAGNHLLLDVTAAIQQALASGVDLLGILLEDDIHNGTLLGILGSNYNSGDPTQYYASSLYEYPTLIVTTGSEITPFDQLPARPITNDPLGPPPLPSDIPEPTSVILMSTMLLAVAYVARKQIACRL
jgi:hypothetical protein